MRVLTLSMALAALSLPAQASSQSPQSPSVMSGLVTGLVTGVAVGGGGTALLCATVDFDDDPLNPASCFALGAAVSVLPGLAAGWALTRSDRTSFQGRLYTMLAGAVGGLAEGAVLSTFSGGASPSDSLLFGTGWGAGVGLVTALVGPSLQSALFPSVRRGSDGGTEFGLRLRVR